MSHRFYWVSVFLLLLLFIFMMAILRLFEDLGVDHRDVELAGGLTSTLYLPDVSNLPKRPETRSDQRIPGVLLVHGYSLDRQMMSVLARRLTNNGYGVLTIDLRGHGDNHNPIPDNLVPLLDDVASAVRYLRRQPMIDPSRIVLIGHSFGASLVLGYAEQIRGSAGSWYFRALSRSYPGTSLVFCSFTRKANPDYNLTAKTSTRANQPLERVRF
jgi:alpha-beta hydrolase superfamily lysophospholipase